MKWHHSLYWRFAGGFVACLALLLVVQAILFVWVIATSAPTIPNQPPDRLAQTIALDVSQAIARDDSLDIAQYIRDEYARDAQPFFVLLRGGRSVDVGGPFPENVVREAQGVMARLDEGRFEREGPPLRGEPFRGDPFGRGQPFGPPAGFTDGRGGPRDLPNRPERGGPAGRGLRGAPGGRFARPAPILQDGLVAGLVFVPPQPPFTFLLGRYAPTLGLVAAATLIVGALLAAVVIFGPARKRLRAVEDAARRLGSGDLDARAPATGGDEVAAVASAFNAMADDLSARANALAASDRARRQLLADVSHELTTPVTAMRGYLETLSMPELQLDEATRARYLAIIGDETGRLERIIGDLLDLARLEGGGGSIAVSDVAVDQLFARVVARHERAATAAGVTFHTEVEPGAAIVHGDRDRLEQALQNLAANALRYAPSGSAIELRARREGAPVLLTVADAGAGIAPDHLPYIFDRFYKADASRAAREGKEAAEGSGLGLSIVKAIVERHGGAISVRSEPGQTVFQLTLP